MLFSTILHMKSREWEQSIFFWQKKSKIVLEAGNRLTDSLLYTAASTSFQFFPDYNLSKGEWL